MRLTLVSIAAAVFLCGAPRAFAGDIDCVWRALPEGVGDKLLAAVDAGMEPDFEIFANDDAFIDKAVDCLPRIDSDRQGEAYTGAMYLALTGSLYERSAGRWLLEDDDGEIAEALRTGWAALSTRERRRLGSLKTLQGPKAQQAFSVAYDAMGYDRPKAGDADQAAFVDALAEYFMGRAMREFYEAQF